MPFVMKWPGVMKPGRRSTALSQNIDFAPTFLDAAGADVPEAMHGVSLRPLAKGKVPKTWRKSLYYHYYERGEHHVPRHDGVRTDRYKLIHYQDTDEWELFDLKKDPQEMKSVYGDSDYAKIANEMHSEYERIKKYYNVPATKK